MTNAQDVLKAVQLWGKYAYNGKYRDIVVQLDPADLPPVVELTTEIGRGNARDTDSPAA